MEMGESAAPGLETMMKQNLRRWGWLLVVFVAGGALHGTPVLGATTKPPRTVLDYYMLLQDDGLGSCTSKERLDLLDPKRGGVKDVRNGYLETIETDSQELL